jgi:hypothetical protein
LSVGHCPTVITSIFEDDSVEPALSFMLHAASLFYEIVLITEGNNISGIEVFKEISALKSIILKWKENVCVPLDVENSLKFMEHWITFFKA